MPSPFRRIYGLGLLALLTAATAQAAPRDVVYPYILWTKDEAAAIKKRIDTEPWAKKRAGKEFPPVSDYEAQAPIHNLFRYLVLGDKAAGETEKQTLLSFINTGSLEKDQWDWQWHHVDIYQQALRYDALYDQVTPGQRKNLEDTFRRFARFGIEEEPLRGFSGYGRHIGEHFAALALKDSRLIRGIFASRGGMKDFLDNLLDGHFSRDGVNHAPLLGEILLWCRACDHLGLGELGFGYEGKNGGTVRKFLEGAFLTGTPRLEVPGSPPYYGKLFFGRLKGYADASPGFLGDLFPPPIAGNPRQGDAAAWVRASHAQFYANDRTVWRMNTALALEVAHQKFPDAHFDYFLASLRGLGQDKYYPSLFWNLDPIDPAKTSPPPSPSGVYPQAQLVVLHAEETPAFWDSPAPSVSFNMAGARGGWTGDAFAITSFYAFNRPLYHNPRSYDLWRTRWTPSGRSNSSVVVDNLQLDRRIENTRWVKYSRWPQAVPEVPSRHGFDPLVKFAAFRSVAREVDATDPGGKPTKQIIGVYPGVDMERAAFLTREYLLDVFRVASDKPRTYHWIVHPLGQAAPEAPGAWKPSSNLDKQIGDPNPEDPTFSFADEHALDTGGKSWSLVALQTCALSDPTHSKLGPAWYDRKVGVRVTMLGEPGTTASYAKPVELKPKDDKRPARKKDEDPEEDTGEPLGASEVGGFAIVAARLNTPATTFVALHEPFEKGQWHLTDMRRIAQTDQAVGVAVRGQGASPVNDRLLLRLGDNTNQPTTLADKETGESFTFSDRAFVRVGLDKVEASGPLTSMKLKVAGSPKLLLNRKEQPATVTGGFLTFGP